MRRDELLTVQSMRPFSCRQSIGVVTDVTQLLQLPPLGVTLGSGYRLMNAWPPGLSRFDGI